jgi:hypothetical protein
LIGGAYGADYQGRLVWPWRARIDIPHAKFWQAWLEFVVFIILIALTARLDGESAWIARIGVIAAFLGLGYFTYDPE